jgi:PAS domain S-box-containing protein
VSQVILAHKDARGEVTHFSSIMRDLSERKRIEQVLRTNEERLRTIIEHSTQLHYSHTPDHRLTYVSPQSREFLDGEPEEALVRSTEFLSDHPANARGAEMTETTVRTGQRQPPYELELISRKGRKLWVEVNESPVVLKDRTVAIVGSLTDITARKHAEAATRELSGRPSVTPSATTSWSREPVRRDRSTLAVVAASRQSAAFQCQ